MLHVGGCMIFYNMHVYCYDLNYTYRLKHRYLTNIYISIIDNNCTPYYQYISFNIVINY